MSGHAPAAKADKLEACPRCDRRRLCPASLICTGCGAEFTAEGLAHFRARRLGASHLTTARSFGS